MNPSNQAMDPQNARPTHLNAIASNLVEIVKTQQEEESEWENRKRNVTALIEKYKDDIKRLELEKSEIDAQILTLRLRDKAYQKEHTSLRNAVTIVKYQIEKIKESIAIVKANELKDLENFEKAVDEITENFRSGPTINDRRNLLTKLNEEKELTKNLEKELQELKQKYADFNKENGLRERIDENEDFLNCVLSHSELHSLMETERNLDVVINELKQKTKDVQSQESELKNIDDMIDAVSAKIAEINKKKCADN